MPEIAAVDPDADWKPVFSPKGGLAEFSQQAGISISFASQIINRRRVPTVGMTLAIYAKTGKKFGLIEGATREEIAALKRMAKRTGLLD